MITVKEVENLAKLARIKVSDEEKESLAKEIDNILVYIDQIKTATTDIDHTPTPSVVRNILRDDVTDPITIEDRNKILDEAPYREGGFLAVKKIIIK